MSTIDERWNIVDTTRAFCQKVLPLVYDESLSYMELVCKLSSKLNEVIENNNNLPQYVKDLIKETVNSDEFTQIVGSVLMDTIINVKFPPEGITPAKGDGVTDDTASIQSCLDYAKSHGGAVVFFPSGKYLTGTLSINTETSILGADRYNTSLVLKGGGNTPLLQGVINQSVRNICLDGNRLNQVEENYLIDGTINMALFDNVILCDSAHCIAADACNNSEFCNVMCKDIGDGVFITAQGNANLLTNINSTYAINLTGDNNNWQSAQQTKIDSVEPLIYQEPQVLNDNYNYITAKDENGNVYKILVEGVKGVGSVLFDSPEEYGAVGDGVTDDTNAFIQMFASNKTHIFNPLAKYLISPSNIALKGSVDFNGTTLVINNLDNNDAVFTNEANTSELVITETDVSNNRILNASLFGKSFFLKSPICMGKSIIDDSIIYYSQLLVTDEKGYFINTPFYPNIKQGSYTCTAIQDAAKNNVEIRNVNVHYKNSGHKNRFLHSTRNNLTIKNITVTSDYAQEDLSDIIVISNCYNVTIDNVIGSSLSIKTSYLLGLYNLSNVLVKNLVNNNTSDWHEIGGDFLSNFKMENCCVKAYDCHYLASGYQVITNCTIKELQLGNGFYDMLIENCVRLNNPTLANYRRDTTIFHNGTFTYRGCQGKVQRLHYNYVSDNLMDKEYLEKTVNYYISDCDFDTTMFSMVNISQRVNLYFKNCTYSAQDPNPSKQNVNVTFDNCKSNYDGVVYNPLANNVKILNTVFSKALGIRECENAEIFNCDFDSIYVPAGKEPTTLTVIGCRQRLDVNMTNNIRNITNYGLAGNTLVSETKTNLGNVNGVK